MPAMHKHRQGGTPRVPAIARYTLVCLAIGAAVAALVVVAVGEPSGHGVRVALPPLRETRLVQAARAGGCELRRARHGEQLRPPVDGRRGAPARAQFYDAAPPVAQLTAAIRRGVIVISYRSELDRKRLEQLRTLQTLVPRGMIVSPDSSRMRYAVAVGAYRHLLGCPRFTDAALDAMRLFTGHFIGAGPDR